MKQTAEEIAFELAEKAEPQLRCMSKNSQRAFIHPYKEDIEEAMKEHTQSRLQQIREEVKNNINFHDRNLQDYEGDTKQYQFLSGIIHGLDLTLESIDNAMEGNDGI